MINNVCDGEILWAFASGGEGNDKKRKEEIFVRNPGKTIQS